MPTADEAAVLLPGFAGAKRPVSSASLSFESAAGTGVRVGYGLNIDFVAGEVVRPVPLGAVLAGVLAGVGSAGAATAAGGLAGLAAGRGAERSGPERGGKVAGRCDSPAPVRGADICGEVVPALAALGASAVGRGVAAATAGRGLRPAGLFASWVVRGGSVGGRGVAELLAVPASWPASLGARGGSVGTRGVPGVLALTGCVGSLASLAGSVAPRCVTGSLAMVVGLLVGLPGLPGAANTPARPSAAFFALSAAGSGRVTSRVTGLGAADSLTGVGGGGL